ncbi:DUF4169 family protein [Microvirga tunisiensis]|uniref:DUF4169 family protein n=1 Tax=Pannonibacter tanglangensis TaxID=2750084 RepID=A0A7X5EZK2_9HYPH|nr:DUF4169 family protein [Pannonibacter sp. XCT-53]NBN77028.1 DUF4169 family protein [Pannonibacter sp. XCT-53]
MAADIVNLRQARKQRDRKDREATAEANRVRYGRSKADRKLAEAREEIARRHLDGHRLADGDPAATSPAADTVTPGASGPDS